MFGQVVVGSPGSGKTTYCDAMKKFMESLGREVEILNLDPANDNKPYKCSVDIQELITVEDVMEELSLGPNGALIYCMEYLVENFDWLRAKLQEIQARNSKTYLLMDFPGQVELYMHNDSVKNVLKKIQRLSHRVVAVHLTDSHCCSDPAKFISVLLNSLAAMLQLEAPHINILSKIDIVEKFGPLPFNLEYFCDVLDLRHILQLIQDNPSTKTYYDISKAVCDVIENYSIVSFYPLNIEDKESMEIVLAACDKANGYCFGDMMEKHTMAEMMGFSMNDSETNFIQTMQERYCKNSPCTQN